MRPTIPLGPLALLLVLHPLLSLAAVYECPATRKVDSTQVYTPEMLAKGQFSTRVEELGKETYVSRCSFAPSEGKVTCDRYKVDRVVTDPNVGHKKFYVFSSQYDFQIFKGLLSVENNGRGGIQYGQCKLTSP